MYEQSLSLAKKYARIFVPCISNCQLKEEDLLLQSFDYCTRCVEQNVHRKLLPIKTFTAWIVDFSVLFRDNLNKLFHLEIEI